MTSKTCGVLKRLPRGGGFLRNPENSFLPSASDAFVSNNLIKKYRLFDGAEICGTASRGQKGVQLDTIESVCGLKIETFSQRLPFDRLVAIDPFERIKLGDSGDISMRIVEMIAPIGKGTRGLIVAPPKSGKTTLLENMAHAINLAEPETRLVILLIDERPEEVTHFRRKVQGEVLASSSDQSIQSHVNLVELTMAHVRCELESGKDVIVLIDSLTRMSRAFNSHGTSSKRTLTGGLDSRAMEIPRRFFGLARNIDNGGSVTIIATAQIDTGSRMDNFIFEEFKGTGNSEIVLDRTIAESRIFPAINILKSGTRKEELLYDMQEVHALGNLRRQLANYDPKTAMSNLVQLVKKTKDNREIFTMMHKL